MIPIIKQSTAPENNNAVWIDVVENNIKIFGANGWEVLNINSSGSDYTGLQNQIKQLEITINNLLYSNTTDGIDSIEELRSFLDGFKDTDNLKEAIEEGEDLSWHEV